MGKYSNVILLVSVITLAITFAGCVDSGQDITPVLKSIPEVQQFLQDHPNAKITVTYWSEEEVSEISDNISIQCDKNINPRALYKATISEGDLKIVSWIDAETQIVICTATQGYNGPTATPTATPIATSTATPTATPTTTPTTTPTATPTTTPTATPTTTPTATPTTTPTATPKTYNVVICEVIYDPPGAEPDDELIKLCNQGSSAVDISGWRLTDGEGTYTIPSGTTLAASSSWSVLGFTYNPTRYTQGFYLANSQDEVILYDKVGNKVDEYRW